VELITIKLRNQIVASKTLKSSVRGWLRSQPRRTKRGMMNIVICRILWIMDLITRFIWHLLVMAVIVTPLAE
jgi:hypothetical protein